MSELHTEAPEKRKSLQVETRPDWVGDGPGVAPAEEAVGGAVGVPATPTQTK